tara:strand:- start:7968 stop:10013 length:2046 start_codon:yes stop_codon:yes gene_type:complete
MDNRLINETSPYLLQHAQNPVDWYPWGNDAFNRAKNEDKPILLSVGYSACHWCHVMESESFENLAIAEIMNEKFVCIKVDREERPDVDAIYMSAVQAMTGQGGWPMTVFLTPDGEPFFGGTYFPPQDRGGLPAFPRVLEVMADTYRDKRSEVLETSQKLISHIRGISPKDNDLEILESKIIDTAFSKLQDNFDNKYGGFGLQPKFPQPMIYEFLLKYYIKTGLPEALEMVEVTLNNMAAGGIYDHLRGGFHRYSTDTYWLVPHFEKMLYDNALLIRLYLHAYQVTGNNTYRVVVEETLDYVIAEMTDKSGGFFSSQDADTEGEEGKYFVWRPEEIEDLLGKEQGSLFNKYFNVDIDGNFEGMSILNVTMSKSDFMFSEGLEKSEFENLISQSKSLLLESRATRTSPGIDDKILTSWNSLMIGAFAEAGSILGRSDYVSIAERGADYILKTLVTEDRLLRTSRNGQAKLQGYLEDYSFLVNSLILLHEATLSQKWLNAAIKFTENMINLFWDKKNKQFYDTGIDHESLIIRPINFQDNAIPSGAAIAADVLLKMAVITGRKEFEQYGKDALKSSVPMLNQYPLGAGHWLCVLDFYLDKTKEIVVLGKSKSCDTKELVAEVFRHYIPNRVFVGNDVEDETVSNLPILQRKNLVNGKATAFVCEDYVCSLPSSTPESFAKQLSI